MGNERSTGPVIAVGSAASSGSTLLADLLDAVPGLVCGPELSILCLDAAYDYDAAFKQAARARKSFPIRSSLLSRSRFFNTRHLAAVGLDPDALDRMIAGADSLRGFVGRFAAHYAAFRGRDGANLAEKTPQNIAYAGRFLAAFPEGLFVVIVRDGRSVVGSLRRRGYTLYEAALVWLWETSVGRQARASHPRVAEVRYEDLVAEPFATVARLAGAAGIEADPSSIECSFRANEYRAGLDRLACWRARTYTGMVQPGLAYEQDLSPDEVAFLEASVLCLPGGENVRFDEALAHYGYPPADRGRPVGPDALERHAAEYRASSRNLAIQQGHRLALGDPEPGAAPSPSSLHRSVAPSLDS